MENKITQTVTKDVFTKMVRDSFQTTLEVAHRRMFDKLKVESERRNEVEFAYYLENERAKILADPGWERYDMWKETYLRTIDSAAFMVAFNIENSSSEPVDWKNQWRKGAWVEMDFVKDYKHGLALVGELYATEVFQNETAISLGNLMPHLLPLIQTLTQDATTKEISGNKKSSASNPAVKEPKTLPAFEDAVKEPEKLPVLWKSLSDMEKPFVSESGNLLEKKRPHSILMAFAQALLRKDKIKNGIDVREMYLILCRFFVVDPSSRPDKIKERHRYKDFLSDITGCM